MAAHWDALVLNNYEYVMPVTWKKKFGISYLYQPAFVQQGGIFSKKIITGEHIDLFLSELIRRFSFAEITLNFANSELLDTKGVAWSVKKNYVLDINKPYDSLLKNLTPAFKKSLRRIQKFNFKYTIANNYKDIIQLYKDLYAARMTGHHAEDYRNFEKVCDIFATEDKLIIRSVESDKNKFLASALLINDGNRLYNMISCVTEEGKRLEANYFLYEKIISEFSNTGVLLDLEGSDVPGIEAFYIKFNPASQPYYFAKYNRLHPLVKMMKK
jgi:hypothetical protein